MRTLSVALVAFALVSGRALAGDPPPAPSAAAPVSAPPVSAPPISDWAPNETVVVSVQGEGPAFWHVKKGESEIWILGVVGPMPKGLPWNSARLGEIIKGARLVYTPAKASAGFFETSWFLLTHRGLLSMPDGKKLEDTLPPDLKTRFVAARTALKKDADEYENDPPVLTTFELLRDYNKAHGLESDDPWETITRLAKQNKVPMKPVGEYGALVMVKEMLRLPPEAQVKCLDEAVAYTEHSNAHNRAMVEGWAAGSLKQIKAHYYADSFGGCIKQAASFDKFKDRAVADYMKVIHDALSVPGKVVMVTDIGNLLRSAGVAEALHKEGVTIEGPAE